jgi:hypothetical protein
MPHNPLTDVRVLEFLNSTVFATIRQIAAATTIPRSTVLDHLQGWSYTVRHLKSAPRHLPTAMMEQRVELSRELLITLMSVKHRGWTHFLTGYESWFWLTIDSKQQWLTPGAERSTKPRKIISSLKVMTIIFG